MTRVAVLLLLVVTLMVAPLGAASNSDADKVWSLEQAYWRYVQAADLQGYRTLWNANFLGWPSVSPEPLGKDHITDWITAHSGQGEALKSYDLERLRIQVTGNLTTVTYRARLTWADKNGAAGEPTTIRILHTWLRQDHGKWQIISGMSAATNAEGH